VGGVWAERVKTAVVLCRNTLTRVGPGVNPRVDDVPYAAPLGLTGSRPERDDRGVGVGRDGGWSQAVMVAYSAVLVVAAVVLAVADRLA
jgi:hypothetical protein